MRSLLRHRDGLVRAAATCVHRLHKALTQMNVQLQHVIADVTGVTGLAILEAILKGERDPVALAKLKDGRIRASTDVIAKSLRGDWRSEHLFTLRQCLETWSHYQGQITACDAEIARLLQGFTAKVDMAAHPLPPRTSTHKSPQKNEPRFEARAELYRTCGVDLTQVPGLQSGTALVLLAELGPDFAERFPTAKHFGSWLGLSPDNRITGGKIMSSASLSGGQSARTVRAVGRSPARLSGTAHSDRAWPRGPPGGCRCAKSPRARSREPPGKQNRQNVESGSRSS
ncbi:MAG TPA: transposase [Verrucomicrobiae bacterium]